MKKKRKANMMCSSYVIRRNSSSIGSSDGRCGRKWNITIRKWKRKKTIMKVDGVNEKSRRYVEKENKKEREKKEKIERYSI